MPSKPILLTVDDDPDVLRAIERDLRRHYGKDYRVLRADAGATALDTLRQLDARGEPVALFLVDQRMPQMSGVEFLEQARAVFPAAKRVLLTAYADTDAAIKAINTVRVDYYALIKWNVARRASPSSSRRSSPTRTWTRPRCKRSTCMRAWRAR